LSISRTEKGNRRADVTAKLFVYWDHELKQHPGLTISPAEYHEEQAASLRPLAFLRLHENRFTSNESAFITPDQWEACYSPEVEPLKHNDTRRIILGADASTSRDLTALVGIYVNRETNTRDVVFVRAWKPQKGELRGGRPTVDLDVTIKAEIYRLWKAGNVLKVYYDPYQLHSIGLELEKAGCPVVELPQTDKRVEADQAFYDGIITKQVRHFNHPDLNEHVHAAVAAETPRGYRLTKEKTSRKIDLAVASSMAHFGALEFEKGPIWLIR
jgi:phage terminase large subunit-like protein